MKYFSNDGLDLLLFIGVGGGIGAVFTVGLSPFISFLAGFESSGMFWASFWKVFEVCVYFGMGIGFLVGLAILLVSKR
jgi:hypothetical protein